MFHCSCTYGNVGTICIDRWTVYFIITFWTLKKREMIVGNRVSHFWHEDTCESRPDAVYWISTTFGPFSSHPQDRKVVYWRPAHQNLRFPAHGIPVPHLSMVTVPVTFKIRTVIQKGSSEFRLKFHRDLFYVSRRWNRTGTGCLRIWNRLTGLRRGNLQGAGRRRSGTGR